MAAPPRIVLSESHAAKAVGVPVGFLRSLRRLGSGPPYVRYAMQDGPARVGYIPEDLEAWAKEQRILPSDGIRAAWRDDT